MATSDFPSFVMQLPPDILDHQTSQDLTVPEGFNVTLTCTASGVPDPTILWKRAGEKPLPLLLPGDDLFAGTLFVFIQLGSTEVKHFAEHVYKVSMHTQIHLQRNSDFGIYKCVAKNGFGISEDAIKIQKRISKITIQDDPPTIVLDERHEKKLGKTVSQKNQFRELVLLAKNSVDSGASDCQPAMAVTLMMVLLSWMINS
ncbi:conserved hypothetical protein [Culex quinquefasciatus]|uniref:Ig-like domain-containing protein n=1 Tax=Culex quinquefasciatus TaxID=7176 RepID=B0X974_CULQU|nr:conserved hypothetical protein [Culex quinquefasciatus]|eukprot:XP_001866196.1 conserved hypothetical protein [Culex quinquefasciatus]